MTGAPEAGPAIAAESEALARYRAASRRRGSTSNRRRGAMRALAQTPSGPGPDARDPQRVGDVWRRLADGNGWTAQLAVWSLANRWPEIVGPQIAEHVSVVAFDAEAAPDPRADGGSARRRRGQPRQQSLLPAPPPADEAGGREGGTLTVVADSPAWQQQLIWNLALLQRRLDAELGAGVVGRVVILGPAQGRRPYGPRRVRT